mgnify:CR=1 FL=1
MRDSAAERRVIPLNFLQALPFLLQQRARLLRLCLEARKDARVLHGSLLRIALERLLLLPVGAVLAPELFAELTEFRPRGVVSRLLAGRRRASGGGGGGGGGCPLGLELKGGRLARHDNR